MVNSFGGGGEVLVENSKLMYFVVRSTVWTICCMEEQRLTEGEPWLLLDALSHSIDADQRRAGRDFLGRASRI
jgi:hypothetical protein